jgi:restriction endonuclease S subunit
MREDWARVRLADVAEESRERVMLVTGIEYRAVGVLRDGKGLLDRPPFIGGKTNYKKLTPIHEGQLILRSITAWEAPSTVAKFQHEGAHVSGVFPVFNLKRELILPGYMNLICQSAAFWNAMRIRCTGSVLRRKTLSVRAFLDIPIDLPPLEEQRRIVDLVQILDIAEDEAGRTSEAHSELSKVLVDNWVQDWNGPVSRLGDVARMGSGSGWKSSDERPESGDGRLRVLGITNTPPGGAITLDQAKYVEGLPKSTPKLSESSLLMIRTNGNRVRIGNVYRIPPKARGCAFSAFQIGIHFGSSEEATFAYWMLSDSRVQSQISLAASGSTGLGNVAITWLRDLEIPWPDSEASKIAISQLFDSAGECVMAGRNLQDTYVELRFCLLSQLLSGSHGIATSYDSILEMVS